MRPAVFLLTSTSSCFISPAPATNALGSIVAVYCTHGETDCVQCHLLLLATSPNVVGLSKLIRQHAVLSVTLSSNIPPCLQCVAVLLCAILTGHRASTSIMYSLTFRARVTTPQQYGQNGTAHAAGASMLSPARGVFAGMRTVRGRCACSVQWAWRINSLKLPTPACLRR